MKHDHTYTGELQKKHLRSINQAAHQMAVSLQSSLRSYLIEKAVAEIGDCKDPALVDAAVADALSMAHPSEALEFALRSLLGDQT